MIRRVEQLAVVCLTVMLPVGGVFTVVGRGETASPVLQCRQAGEHWSACRMIEHQPGEHWFLDLGAERIEFRHDGRGQVRMRVGEGRWLTVEPRWESDQDLCWGAICARGELPLD